MLFRVPIFAICAAIAFAGCEKNPNADETPQPTQIPRPVAHATPYPRVTPWALVRRNAGPDTAWLYRQPTPTPVPSNFKPFHSSLDGASMMDNPPPGNTQPGATPKAFHSSLDDPPQRGGGK